MAIEVGSQMSPQNPGQTTRVGNLAGRSPPHGGAMNIYAALDAEWATLANTTSARNALSRWQQREPTLIDSPTPASLVASITSARRWGRSDPRLGALLRLADENLAARAALQAVLPGLRAEPLRYWRHHCRLAEPGDDLDEVTAELVGAAWEVIRSRAGQTLDDPENTLVRAAVEKLRTRRRAETRRQARQAPLPPDSTSGRITQLHEARSSAEQVVAVLVDAVRANTVTARQADLVYAVRVARISGRTAGQRYGMTPGQVFHTIDRAETALTRASA